MNPLLLHRLGLNNECQNHSLVPRTRDMPHTQPTGLNIFPSQKRTVLFTLPTGRISSLTLSPKLEHGIVSQCASWYGPN